MNCSSPAGLIACAIRASVEPSLFDYLAYVIVPVFLGIVTLTVALASWRVAKSSLALSTSIAEDQKKREGVTLRLSLADSAFNWSARRWTGEKPEVSEKSRRAAEMGRPSVALTESTLPGAADLQDFLWEINRAESPEPLWSLPELDQAFVLTYSEGYFSSLTERAIMKWLRGADHFTEYGLELRGEIPEMYEGAFKKAKDYARKRVQKAKSSKESGARARV